MYSDEIKGLILNLSKQTNLIEKLEIFCNYLSQQCKIYLIIKNRGIKRNEAQNLRSTILKKFIKKEHESDKKVNATKIMRSNDLSCSR